MTTVTIPKGRILWHARWQPINGNRRNVMNSPDYLYTTPQISQALLHGIQTHKDDTIIELTKLRVREPLVLLNFKTARNQENIANKIGINKFQTFTTNDTKLLRQLCMIDEIDGYRAIWDQDQIALCAKVIRTKLEKMSSQNYRPTTRLINKVAFTHGPGESMYYQTLGKSKGRRIVSAVKRREKESAIQRKNERTRLYRATSIAKTFKKPPSTPRVAFKRPTIKRKR